MIMVKLRTKNFFINELGQSVVHRLKGYFIRNWSSVAEYQNKTSFCSGMAAGKSTLKLV